jgi:BirA family biotin operon repressor/biotin-[acetyl-CoA-carboxylase] ligase
LQLINKNKIDTNITEFPPEIADIATSLQVACGVEIEHETLLEKLFEIFADELPEFIDSRLKNSLEYYKQHCFLKDKQIVLSTEFENFTGRVQGVNSKGALLMEIKEGMIQPFYSGSVEKIY